MDQPSAATLRDRFDTLDRGLNGGRGYSDENNEKSLLAWSESYLLMSYVDMYEATGDPDYLRRLCGHFARILKQRDDVRGKADAYAGKPLAGWGSGAYSDGAWHAWIVHTGMITLGASEFVRLAHRNRRRLGAFAAEAREFRERIAECVRDAEPFWRPGPGRDEGAYFGAHLKAVLPLNQQNVLGSVQLELSAASGDRAMRRRAEHLARWFQRRLRRPEPNRYDWAYWPREVGDGSGSEDISHASLNVDFVVRCARERVVFRPWDLSRFARAWIDRVRRDDGGFAGTVGGTGDGARYLPFAAGAWMALVPRLPKSEGRALYDALLPGAAPETAGGTTGMLGIARTLRARQALGL